MKLQSGLASCQTPRDTQMSRDNQAPLDCDNKDELRSDEEPDENNLKGSSVKDKALISDQFV
jgi:hypothetical protein